MNSNYIGSSALLRAASSLEGIPGNAWRTFVWASKNIVWGIRRGLTLLSPKLVVMCHKIGDLFQKATPFIAANTHRIFGGVCLLSAIVVPLALLSHITNSQHHMALRVFFAALAIFHVLFSVQTGIFMMS